MHAKLAQVRGEQPQAKVAHVNELFFVEQRFLGSDPHRKNVTDVALGDVIRTKTGQGHVLAALYYLLATDAGLSVEGVLILKHMCIKIHDGSQQGAVLYVCNKGRLWSSSDFEPGSRQQMVFIDNISLPARLSEWFFALAEKHIEKFKSQKKYESAVTVKSLQIALEPDSFQLQKELALLLSYANRYQEAAGWFNSYLQNNPSDPQRESLVELLFRLQEGNA